MNTGFLGPAVATVLTACGIETYSYEVPEVAKLWELQQYLPLAVLKRICDAYMTITMLQQYLPLAVLKLSLFSTSLDSTTLVATVLTACGIETHL